MFDNDGERSGFQARLKVVNSEVFVMDCIYHFALCTSYAARHLPSSLESVMNDICGYFSRSSKRACRNSNTSMKQLKPSSTGYQNWPKLGGCLEGRWEPLLQFFQAQTDNDRVDGTAQIHKIMITPGTYHMFLFLNFILPKIDKMNRDF